MDTNLDEKHLLERVLDACQYSKEDVVDVSLAGSYLWGEPTEQSDIDCVVWVEKVDRPKLLRVLYSKKFPKLLSIKIRDVKEKNDLFWGKYRLPKKSLLTGKWIDKNKNNIKEYLAYRKRHIIGGN